MIAEAIPYARRVRRRWHRDDEALVRGGGGDVSPRLVQALASMPLVSAPCPHPFPWRDPTDAEFARIAALRWVDIVGPLRAIERATAWRVCGVWLSPWVQSQMATARPPLADWGPFLDGELLERYGAPTLRGHPPRREGSLSPLMAVCQGLSRDGIALTEDVMLTPRSVHDDRSERGAL